MDFRLVLPKIAVSARLLFIDASRKSRGIGCWRLGFWRLGGWLLATRGWPTRDSRIRGFSD
jgi:hypothetical protein